MSRGLTIADLVQQVYYAVYKVRLDVRQGTDGSFHSKSDKFQEVVMEANFVLQELQKEQDWNWLRDRLELGISENPPHRGIQEFVLPGDVYKPCTGYNDAVRLRNRHNPNLFMEIPWTSPRSGNAHNVSMFDQYASINAPDQRVMAFQVGQDVTFTRPWRAVELGCLVETDVVRLLPQLHICDDSCPDDCPLAYEKLWLTEVPDPLYVVLRTAAYRAEGDPSVSDRAIALPDQAQKLLSSMRENDSAHTVPDTYRTSELGFMTVL